MTNLESALAGWHIPELPVEYEEIARKYGISAGDVKDVISRVESLCFG